jgi:hypothetical protein
MAPITPLIERGYEGERKGKRWQFRARPCEGTRRQLDWGAGDSAGWGRRGGGARRARARREVEEVPDSWAPSGGDKGRKAGWASLGWAGSTSRLGFQFLSLFSKNINKYIFKYFKNS